MSVNVGTVTSNDPRSRVRVNVTKNTKGYQHETTAEVEWAGPLTVGEELLARLLRRSDELAREEIARRMSEDEKWQ